ncbi:MAG TPA: hypothetical protein VLD65_02640, partial [Anaerolineales bacterium]|nr:hypothetical protein [Anaerolineales bacterium]
MAAGKAINRISQILKESGLSWLLPNIRQDIVVWGALNDAALVDRVTQLHPSYSDYRPKDFSPSKLAHLASDLCDIARVNLDQPLDSMDRQFTQVVNNNRLPLLSAAVKELASADSSALTWLNQFNQTKSWNGLLSDVRENINQEWKSIIACLYGLLEDPIELLRRLIQSEGSGLMPELAVHAVLSNPFTTNEQLAILVDLCHEVSGDPVPPSSRLSLIHA